MLLVATLLCFGSITAWIVHLFACMGGCLACASKRSLISSVDVPPLEEQKLHCRKVPKRGVSEHIWTTSTCDMDNSGVQSPGSISPVSASNNPLDVHGTGNVPSEFVNHGLLLWIQTRQLWIGNKHSKNRTKELCEPRLSWNATYDSVLGSNKQYRKPIPLPEMVDFLVDIWIQEGMYD